MSTYSSKDGIEEGFQMRMRVVKTLNLGSNDLRKSKRVKSVKNLNLGSDKKGSCGKTRYRDHEEAADALHRIEVKRYWHSLEGTPCRRRETRIYFHPACKGFHLTSHSHDNGGLRRGIEEAA